jgi:hypothetical protein
MGRIGRRAASKTHLPPVIKWSVMIPMMMVAMMIVVPMVMVPVMFVVPVIIVVVVVVIMIVIVIIILVMVMVTPPPVTGRVIRMVVAPWLGFCWHDLRADAD